MWEAVGSSSAVQQSVLRLIAFRHVAICVRSFSAIMNDCPLWRRFFKRAIVRTDVIGGFARSERYVANVMKFPSSSFPGNYQENAT
jgi:hypothetical protein